VQIFIVFAAKAKHQRLSLLQRALALCQDTDFQIRVRCCQQLLSLFEMLGVESVCAGEGGGGGGAGQEMVDELFEEVNSI